MDDQDAVKVLEYVREHIPEPDITLAPEFFEEQAYSQWAGDEILERVYKELEILPEHISGKASRSLQEVIEEFVDEMSCYADKAEDDKVKNMFAIARDEGICMLMYVS